MPPFAGMDEWDHVYRASSVAHGQWVAPPSEATRGTGAFVQVPSDIVRAARTECERLNYGGENECIGTTEGELAEVASGAGRYHPLYYSLVGWPSRFLAGDAALYGMRLVGLLLCWTLLMASLRLLRRWSGPLLGLVVCLALTPTVVYATVIVAPNGLEMVSGLALWVVLATLVHGRRREALDPWTVGLGVVSGTLLLSLRSLGPLWAALIVGIALLAWPGLWPRTVELLRSRKGAIAALWLCGVAFASIWWIRSQGSLRVGTSDEGQLDLGERIGRSLKETLVWTFQYIGAFPHRNNPAPALIYVTALTVLITIGVMAVRCATRRERWAISIAVGAAYAIPLGITVATIEKFGTAWQGRYALPLLLGVGILCGVVLDRRVSRPRAWVLYGAVLLVMLTHTVATVNTWWLEHQMFVRSSTPFWRLEPNPVALAVIVLSGAAALTFPFARAATQRRE
jgi:hypothetical protein